MPRASKPAAAASAQGSAPHLLVLCVLRHRCDEPVQARALALRPVLDAKALAAQALERGEADAQLRSRHLELLVVALQVVMFVVA